MVPTSPKATTCPLHHTMLPLDLAQWVKVLLCQTTEGRVNSRQMRIKNMGTAFCIDEMMAQVSPDRKPRRLVVPGYNRALLQ